MSSLLSQIAKSTLVATELRWPKLKRSFSIEPFVRRTRQQRLRLIGQTAAGRYLTIFLGPRGGGVFGLITARDATDAERRVYQEHRGR